MERSAYTDLLGRIEHLEQALARQQRLTKGLAVALVAGGATALIAVVLWKLPRPSSLLWREFFNFTHVVLSGGVALAALWASRSFLVDVLRPWWAHYLVAGVTSVTLGAGLEVMQFVGPGDASFGDLVRDGIGVAAAHALALSADSHWVGGKAWLGRWVLRLLAGALVCLSLVPGVRTSLPLMQRRSAFPLLVGFEARWDARFVRGEDGAELFFEPPPAAFTQARGPTVGRVRFASGQYPKLEITGLVGDWAGYEALVLDVYSPEPTALPIELRIHDKRHRNRYGDRFNTTLTIAPGQSRLSIPIRTIRSAPEGREMDLANVQSIILFMTAPTEPKTLFFDTVRLESRLEQDGSSSSPDASLSRHSGVAGLAGSTEAPRGSMAGQGPSPHAGAPAASVCGAEPGQLFLPEYPWNQRIDQSPLDAESTAIIGYLAANHHSKQRFRVDGPSEEINSLYGLTVLSADAGSPRERFIPSAAFFTPDCDPTPIPVPPGGALEGEPGYACASDGDCHLLVVDASSCRLFEMWRANRTATRFEGGCLAVWDLKSPYVPTLRGECCTSADAGGLPIAALMFSADEIARGEIRHALRFILPNQLIRSRIYVRPATHSTRATSGPPSAPPYGARVRLKADFDAARLKPSAQVVARALQRYGMILVDGGNITFTATNDRFTRAKWAEVGFGPNDLTSLLWTDFEVVELGNRLTWDHACQCRRTPITQ